MVAGVALVSESCSVQRLQRKTGPRLSTVDNQAAFLKAHLADGHLYVLHYWVANDAADAHSREAAARARIADEIGDVGIALLLLCDRIGVDLAEAVTAKVAKNRARYPAEKVRGKAERPEG